MTIQEAINHAKEVAEEKYKEGFLCYANSGDAENDKKNDECVKCAKEHEQLAEWLEKLKQYRAIGTVKKCREARERQRVKRPIIDKSHPTLGLFYYYCPICKNRLAPVSEYRSIVVHCEKCGQKVALKWEEFQGD